MQKDDVIRLQHMLDAAKKAIGFCQNKNRKSLDADRQLVLALVKDIEIIGEAATNVSQEIKSNFPEIPWQEIIGMRNRLIYDYFTINLNILWNTVIEDLPPLIAGLENIITQADAH
jgi:uncharacterized protein with HEPN domain